MDVFYLMYTIFGFVFAYPILGYIWAKFLSGLCQKGKDLMAYYKQQAEMREREMIDRFNALMDVTTDTET